ncbi:MAG: ATP-binding protein, partial [Chloroflexota bacterium]|nr:ATP-binding protein [Chloroflexota bacterium]
MATAGVELELARPASTGWLGRIAGQLWATLPEGRALPEAAWRDRHRAVLVLLWLHALGLATFGVALGYGLAHSVAEGAVIAAAAVLAAQPRLGRRWRSAVASLGLITASAVLVHLSGGYVEAHFHFFVMIVVIGLYQDWVPFLIALGYVVLHHGVLGALVPDSVYNHPDALAYPWKWAAIHGAFVLAASAATVASWRLSERVRARIEASEARLRLLTERLPAVLWSTDAALQFVAAQGAGLAALNVRGEQLVGTSLEERFGDQRSSGGGPEGPTMSAHRRALQGESVSFELLWAGRTFEARVEPLRRPDGATTGTVAVAVDVTERLAAESERQRLVTTSQAKSAFLANMSHEIRTPMNAIMGMADLLAETPLSPEQREYVGIFQRAGDSLLALINDILDLSKVEADQLELEQTAFDPAALLEDVAEVLAAPAHAKGLELFCEVSADVPARVVGDPQRLRQVLLNLLGNAVKFTARGEVGLRLDVLPAGSSPLVLPAGTPGDAVNRVALRFAVRDTGIGIPRATLPGVFDPFTQADASTTRRYGGTGLGLAIVKRLVELMGGRIEVESVLERGSVFTITIPLAVTRVVPGAPPAPVVNLSGARVLVVDDHATNRLLLRRLLATQGAAVEEADGGAAALVALHGARIAGAPYDLVLLDRWMPDLDGFEVVTRARAAGEDGAAAARTILL